MPSNHCSNWEYHDWLREQAKQNAEKLTIEAKIFWTDFNDGKELYYIGLCECNNKTGICTPYVTLKMTGPTYTRTHDDGKFMRSLINKAKKMKPKYNSVIDFTNE
jgi:hypothetical protein